MKLDNPFSLETRWLFFDVRFSCFNCGRNNTELHHIAGRISDSPLNAIVLCKRCHAVVNHSEQEEIKYFKLTLKYLVSIDYTFTSGDIAFVNYYKRLYNIVHGTT